MNRLSELGASVFTDFASTADIAEITTCFLMKRGSTTAHNVYTFIRFIRDPANTTLRENTNLTARPETIKGQSKMQFGAKRFVVGANDCMQALTTMDDAFMLDSDHIRFTSPGEWKPPIAIDSAEDHHTSSFVVQSIRGFRWQIERWSSKGAMIVQLDDAIRRDVLKRIDSSLGISIPYERLGNIVVTTESRVALQLVTSSDCRNLGIRALGVSPLRAMALVELTYEDAGCSTSLHDIADEFTVVSIAGPAQQCTVSLYNADGWLLVKRSCALTPKREIRVTCEVHVDYPINRNVDVHLPSGKRVRAHIAWQRRSAKEQAAQHEWDLAVERAPAKRAQAVLLKQKKLILYTGRGDDRAKAVADITSFISQYGNHAIWIWDPYFSAADAIEFLAAAPSFEAEIRIMTSMRADGEDLNYVKEWFGKPGQGIPPLSNVAIRYDIGPAHDRFLICDGVCWQLGCSFNQIGACVSTIIEWPFSDMVRAAFERAWSQARQETTPTRSSGLCRRVSLIFKSGLRRLRRKVIKGRMGRLYNRLVRKWRSHDDGRQPAKS